MDTVNTMSPDTIRARIAELQKAERQHSARDLDAELSKVILAGGDVDAKETEILEAERAARRHRAERLALEKVLPDAVKRAGADQMAYLVRSHDEAASEAGIVVTDIISTLDAFRAAVRRWKALQERGYDLAVQAGALSRETGTELPANDRLGLFLSARITTVNQELFGIVGSEQDQWLNSLKSNGRGADVGTRLFRREID